MPNLRDTSAMAPGIVLLLLTGCAFSGQRLLEARVEKDGQLLLRTQFSVPDRWDKLTAWQRLEAQSFECVGKWNPGPDASEQVLLHGEIRLLLVHAGTPFAAADVEQLGLVRDSGKKESWRLASGEVYRTAKALK